MQNGYEFTDTMTFCHRFDDNDLALKGKIVG